MSAIEKGLEPVLECLEKGWFFVFVFDEIFVGDHRCDGMMMENSI